MRRLLAAVLCVQACGVLACTGRGEPFKGDRDAGSQGMIGVDGGQVPDAALADAGPAGMDGATGRDASGVVTLEAGLAPDAGRVLDEADLRLFNPFAAFPRIDFTLSPSAEQSLRDTPDVYVEASFTLSDEHGRVGPLQVLVRRKGVVGSKREFTEKMAFKIDFNEVVPGQKLFGLRKLSLNNMVQDESAVHEWVAYQLFESQGVPVPRTGYSRVFVNGTQFGIYLNIEATDDKGFLRRNFPSTRVQYEGGYGQDLFEGTEFEFEEETGADPERVALRALTQALSSAPADQVYEQLAPRVHWDEVLATMATEIFIGHWDGYAPTRNNYFIHFDNDMRASLLPWGTDQTFRSELELTRGRGLLLERCRADADCKAAFVDALASIAAAGQAFVDTRSDELTALADKLAREMATDPRAQPSDIRALAAEVLVFLAKRAADVAALRACISDPTSDLDHDGFKCDADCDEGAASRHEGATEICADAIDQDCNDRIDDGDCPPCTVDATLGTKYVFCRRGNTQAEAAAECASRAGALVKLTSAATAGPLYGRARQYFGDGAFWIGLDDRTTEGEWVWSDGSSAGTADADQNLFDCDPGQVGNHYCAWGPAEPNDFNGAEDCASVLPSGEWNDFPCDASLQFVCQVP